MNTRRGRAMTANVAIEGAAGQDVMMSQTGQEPPSVVRAARERTRAEGAGEIDAAAAFGIYAGNSSAARAVPVAAGATITTRYGPQLVAQAAGVRAPRPGRLVVPGPRHTSELDPGFARWAAGHGLGIQLPHACQATANTGYPSAHLRLAGSPWLWRPATPFARTITAVIGVALRPAAAARRHRP